MPPAVRTVIVHSDDLVTGMSVVAAGAYEAWGEWAAFTLVCRPEKEVWTLTADALFDEMQEDEEADEEETYEEEEEPDE